MEVIGMALFLLIVYILFLILHIILNVKAFRNKAKKYWTNIFFIESVSIIIALTVMLYYKSLPGYGMMPGFSYLGEILFSYVAAVLYIICLMISVFVYVICRIKGTNLGK